MSVNSRFLFMFFVFMAILLPLYGCGGGDSGDEAGTPPASQPSTHPASEPSATEYSPSGSSSSCSAPSLLTDYNTRQVTFVEGYSGCLLSSWGGLVFARCATLNELANPARRLDIAARALSANTARILSTGSGWDGDEWAEFALSSGTIRLLDGRSRLRIENYNIPATGQFRSLWFNGVCFDSSSGMENLRSVILTENADIEGTPLSETLSAMDEFLSNYDPDNSDVDGDFDGLDAALERIKTNGSEIEE